MVTPATANEPPVQPTSHASPTDESLVTRPESFLCLIRLIHQLFGSAEPKLFLDDEYEDRLADWETPSRVSTPIAQRQRYASFGESAVCLPEDTDFVSARLTKKLMRQLNDPLALASGSLPNWCYSLSRGLPALFSFSSRLEFLHAAAFGPARSVSWLQHRATSRPSGPVTYTRSLSTASSPGSHSLNGILSGYLCASNSRVRNFLPGPVEDLLARSSAISHLLSTANRALGDSSSSLSAVATVRPENRDQCTFDLNELLSCLFSRASRNQNIADSKDGLVARLHKEFVRVPRLASELLADAPNRTVPSAHPVKLETFWDWATCLMEEHASRKSELEIQFVGEDGTGLGPTLEFYSLLAAELRRRDGLMWVTGDAGTLGAVDETSSRRPSVSRRTNQDENLAQPDASVSAERIELDAELGAAYVNAAHGLFPAPWPADKIPDNVIYRFRVLGITIAKCLQDNRRIDLPLSLPLLKLLASFGRTSIRQVAPGAQTESPSECNCSAECKLADSNRFALLDSVESAFPSLMPRGNSNTIQADSEIGDFLLSTRYRRLHKAATSTGELLVEHWIADVLDLEDFCVVYPERAHFFRKIARFCSQKCILTLRASPHDVDQSVLEELAVKVFGCPLESMCLAMEFLPPSILFGTSSFTLRDQYEWESPDRSVFSSAGCEPEPVTVHNIEHYLVRTLAFVLDKGIRKQMDAFKSGFERVLPLSWLSMFTASELGQLIAGDSMVQWTREDLMAYTVPCLGFTHDSPTYQMLVNILTDFNIVERRAFVQFTTGCSSLPPGGLKNLHPRLRVVRKCDENGAFPSVNTCVHYLKLPEYRSEEELRSVLLRAIREVGFYLN